jgi:hypothetical protein
MHNTLPLVDCRLMPHSHPPRFLMERALSENHHIFIRMSTILPALKTFK